MTSPTGGNPPLDVTAILASLQDQIDDLTETALRQQRRLDAQDDQIAKLTARLPPAGGPTGARRV